MMFPPRTPILAYSRVALNWPSFSEGAIRASGRPRRAWERLFDATPGFPSMLRLGHPILRVSRIDLAARDEKVSCNIKRLPRIFGKRMLISISIALSH